MEMHERIKRFIETVHGSQQAEKMLPSEGMWFELHSVRMFVRFVDLLTPDEDEFLALLSALKG